MNKNKGITLIALIITIIILLILAGITINVLIGENGLFNTAKKAGESYEEAEAREILEAVLLELKADKITKSEYNEQDYIDNKLVENKMGIDGDIATVNGWEFEIDRSIPEIAKRLGKETELKRLTKGKAKFVYDSQTQNVGKVEVTIDIDASISGYTVQYNLVENSETSTNWIDYTAGSIINVTKNITIYGRVIDKTTNEVGYKFLGKITTIDELPPQLATITFDKTETDVNQIIKATVVQSDLESGLDITKCKYIVDQNANKIGEEHASWNTATAFTDATQILDLTKSAVGRYYLHVLSVDKAENKLETVSSMIKFTGTITYYSKYQNAFANSGSTVDTFWNYNYSGRTHLSTGYHSSGSTETAKVISKQKIDVSDVNSLIFNYNKISTYYSNNGGYLDFALSSDAAGNFWVKSSRKTFVGQTATGQSLTLDVSKVEGSYYIVIVLCCNQGSGTGYVQIKDDSTKTIIGYP